MAEIPMPSGSAPPTPVSSERPTGVVCLSCFMIFGGVLNTITGMMILYFGFIYLILGIINIIIAIFLYNLQSWAWTAAMLLNIINFILNLISVIGILAAFVNLAIILYLNQGHVKAAFRKQKGTYGEEPTRDDWW